MKSEFIPTNKELYATCVACLCTFLSGVDLTFSADFFHQTKDITITLDQLSLIGSINVYGAAVSSILVGCFINKIGRKNSLLVVQLCNVIAWTLLYFFANSMQIIFISRAFSGLAAGMVTATVLYITEIAHRSRRGMLLSLIGLSVSLGISITYAIQYISSWHLVSLVALITSVTGFIQTCFLIETKYWYIYQKDEEMARRSIKWFNRSLTDDEVQTEINEIQSSADQIKTSDTSIANIFKNKANIKSFILGFFLLVFVLGSGRMQITSYPLNFYSVFELPVPLSTITLIQGILEVVMSILCTFVIDRLPRKTLLHIICWSVNACLTVACFHYILTYMWSTTGRWVLFVSLMVIYSLSCGFLFTVCYTIVAEITSCTTDARGFVQSILYFIFNILAAVYNQLFPFVLDAVPVNYVLLFFFVNMFLLSFTMFFVTETRNKSLQNCDDREKVVNKF